MLSQFSRNPNQNSLSTTFSIPSASDRLSSRPTATPWSSPPNVPTGTSRSFVLISGSIAMMAIRTLIQLTQSGHDSGPKWSPDGKWIAFLSERKPASGKSDDSDADSDSKDDVSQIYLISPNGGEAFPITQGEEDVHTFSWSADSQTIYFATRQPWSKTQKDDYKQQWKDVVQYRTAERGDTIFSLDVAAALSRHASEPAKVEKKEGEPEKQPDLTPGARAIATVPLRVDDLITSPDGSKLAFITNAINQRQEKYEDVEIYIVDLKWRGHTSPANAAAQHCTLVNPAASPTTKPSKAIRTGPVDNRHLLFSSESEISSAPTAICSRISTGLTPMTERSSSGQRFHRSR